MKYYFLDRARTLLPGRLLLACFLGGPFIGTPENNTLYMIGIFHSNFG